MFKSVNNKTVFHNLIIALVLLFGTGCTSSNSETNNYLHLGWIWDKSKEPLLNELDVASNGTIYVTDEGGTLYAISPRGKTLWSYRGDYVSASPPVVGSDGTIYLIGAQKEEIILYYKRPKEKLYAISPDGKEKWRFEPERPFLTLPLAAPDGSIYIEMMANNFSKSYIYHLTADGKGALLLTSEVDLSISDFGYNQELLTWSGRSDRFIILSSKNEILEHCEETESYPASDVILTPNNSVIYGRSKWSYSPLDLVFRDSNCNIIWNNKITDKQTSGYFPIALGNNGTVFFSGEDGVVQGFASEDGSLLWEKDFTSGSENVIYLLAGTASVNYFLSASALIGVFDNDGNLMWSQPLYEAGHPSFPRVDSSGGLTLVQNGKILAYTSNKLLSHRESSPKPAPQTKSDAEEEIVSFVLDYIVVDEIGGTADYILNTDQPWVEAPPEGNIIIYAPMKVSGSFADIEHPFKVWLYSNEKLLDADKAEIEKFREKYMDNPSSGLWAYGRHEFSILETSDDFMSAKIYIGVICGPRCGHGVEYLLQRSPSGEWWIIESRRTWIS